MKAIVVYYSGSGNNHKIAKALWRGMKDVCDADVASIKEVNPRDMDKYDLIGIGSPIWYFREVAGVRRFISYMPDLTGKLGFVFSCHGTMPSGIFASMIPPIQRKGITIIGWNTWFGSNYYTLHGPKPYPLDGHPDENDLKEAEAWGKEMVERATRIYSGEKDLIPEIPRGPDADPLFKLNRLMTYFPGSGKPHRTINKSKCIYPDCTLCLDNCVVNAIDINADPPTFNIKTCINCAMCDRMCPEQAIEIPDDELYLMRTNKKIDMVKCKYPECTICIDHCAMDAIDFSVSPPVFTRNCEGDDLCWVICPEGAIEITNMDATHGNMRPPGGGADAPDGERKPPEGASPPPGGFIDFVAKREAEGRFTRYIKKEELGKDGCVMEIKRTPRFDINILMQETPAPIYYKSKEKNEK